MGLWTFRIDEDSDAGGRAGLLDSVTMRPLNVPLFINEDEAEDFLNFAREMDLGDLREMGADTLEKLHTAWALTRREPRGLTREADNDCEAAE